MSSIGDRNVTTCGPGVQVCGLYSPPIGFERQHAENASILARIAHARPDLLVVGLGAPKQELWVHRHRSQIQAAAVLCVGATIDFLAGEKHRAPIWMRLVGLEWLHRVASEPKRLARRYHRDAWLFPQIVARELWQASRPTGTAGQQRKFAQAAPDWTLHDGLYATSQLLHNHRRQRQKVRVRPDPIKISLPRH